MSQTIQVNPVELASHLAKYELDNLYRIDAIKYPYEELDEEDDDDVMLTYTPEAQKEFDNWYDWFYKVVTAHDINKPLK